MESKLPPFYVGQKVVYITGLYMSKNSNHVVSDIKQCSCGCWVIGINGQVLKITKPEGVFYFDCGAPLSVDPDYTGWDATSFRARESQPFPLITLTQIQTKELEKEQVKEYDKQLIGKN